MPVINGEPLVPLCHIDQEVCNFVKVKGSNAQGTRLGCTRCGYRYTEEKDMTPLVDPAICQHEGVIDNRNSTTHIVKYWCDDCKQCIGERTREEHKNDQRIANRAILAPEITQRTVSKLYYNSTTPIPCNIALAGINNFYVAAKRLLTIERQGYQCNTVELVSLLTEELEAAMYMPQEHIHRHVGGRFGYVDDEFDPRGIPPVQPRVVPRRTGSSSVASTEYVDVPVGSEMGFDEVPLQDQLYVCDDQAAFPDNNPDENVASVAISESHYHWDDGEC